MFESYTRFNKSCGMQIWTLYGKILEMRSFCTISNLVKNISWDSIKRSYLKVRNICYWCRISSLLFIAPDIKFMTIVGKDGRFASLTVPSLLKPLRRDGKANQHKNKIISYLSCVRSYSLRPRLRPRARFFSLHGNTTRLITYVRNTEKRRRPIHTNFTRKRAEIDCRNIFCFCQTRCMTNGTWAWFGCLAYSHVS